MNFNLNEFDNAQLNILNSYIDNRDVFNKLVCSINNYYSAEQIEIIGKAISLGIDVTGILNSRLSSECMILLCDAIKHGIDVRGLDNANIDILLLRELIRIKKSSSFDMSFIRNLSLSQCRDFVKQFKENKNFDFLSYIDKVNNDRIKSCMEIEYVLKDKTK